MNDALAHYGTLIQAGAPHGVRLVRLVCLLDANRYTARPLEFDESGITQIASDEALTVTNLAEPADTDGQLPSETDAVALDVEGRWVMFVRVGQTGSSVQFPGKIVNAQGSGGYTVREQAVSPAGDFSDATGSVNLTAKNLAELSLGSGASVPNDTIVLVTAIEDSGSPTTLRYVFDHPVYAKYLT